MAQGKSEQKQSQNQQRACSTSYTAVTQRADDYMYDAHQGSNYNHNYDGSTALLMQAKPRDASVMEDHYHSLEHDKNQLANISHQAYPYDRNLSQHHSGQRSSQTSYTDQRADDYAVQQYQRMLLREQARRNRELERR